MEQKRQHYRIHYPTAQRPTIVMGTEEYSVIDLSESGVKFALPDPDEEFVLEDDDEIFSISIKFKGKDSKTFRTNAQYLRSEAGKIIFQLMKPVPLETILSEQRRLSELYPGIIESARRNRRLNELKDDF